MDKRKNRTRRKRRTRMKIRELGEYSLCVNRTPRHIYAQIIDPNKGVVIACASTLESGLKTKISGYTGNIDAAQVIGQAIAERSKEKGIGKVAFDRSGFQYHGRVKALADSARKHGLDF